MPKVEDHRSARAVHLADTVMRPFVQHESEGRVVLGRHPPDRLPRGRGVQLEHAAVLGPPTRAQLHDEPRNFEASHRAVAVQPDGISGFHALGRDLNLIQQRQAGDFAHPRGNRTAQLGRDIAGDVAQKAAVEARLATLPLAARCEGALEHGAVSTPKRRGCHEEGKRALVLDGVSQHGNLPCTWFSRGPGVCEPARNELPAMTAALAGLAAAAVR